MTRPKGESGRTPTHLVSGVRPSSGAATRDLRRAVRERPVAAAPEDGRTPMLNRSSPVRVSIFDSRLRTDLWNR